MGFGIGTPEHDERRPSIATHHPHLAVVTRWGPDDHVMRSLASNLLEHGVHFDHGLRQDLLDDLPEDLEPYKAVVLDAPAMEFVAADEGRRRRLERFASGDGYVFMANDPTERTLRGFHANCLVDLSNLHLVQDILLHAQVPTFAPGWDAAQLARPDDRILEGLADRLLRLVEPMREWGEMALHWWKALKALVELEGREDARDVLVASVRRLGEAVPPGLNHDKVGGQFATVWLYEQTGDRGPMDRARARIDEVIAKRPRHMGVLTGCGFQDDPLGLNPGKDGLSTFFFSNSTNRRQTLWNEGLHLYAPAFGAFARITGDRAYLQEMLSYVEHIRRYQLRDDGLLAHSSSHGTPFGAAWARGQVHALLGMLYLLEEMDRDDPGFNDVLHVIDTVGRALVPHQDPGTGLWRNVIDHPDARLESSGTAGIGYVLARGIREGWLDRAPFEPAVRAAWRGLKRMYWRGGIAANCRGSGASVHRAYYLGRPQGFATGPPTAWSTMLLLELRKLA